MNDMRVLGLPVQFVLVVAISLALTIYFGAWAADARISERAAQASGQQFDFSAAAEFVGRFGTGRRFGAGGAG